MGVLQEGIVGRLGHAAAERFEEVHARHVRILRHRIVDNRKQNQSQVSLQASPNRNSVSGISVHNFFGFLLLG